MTEQICRQWKRTKRHQSALTIALKLGLEKNRSLDRLLRTERTKTVLNGTEIREIGQ